MAGVVKQWGRTWWRAFGLLALFGGATGCASLQPLEETAMGANFPNSPGRTYYLKKSLFGTRILVCDGGPREAVCFEKPN